MIIHGLPEEDSKTDKMLFQEIAINIEVDAEPSKLDRLGEKSKMSKGSSYSGPLELVFLLSNVKR